MFVHDASFIGGWRPFDGGDDGLVYRVDWAAPSCRNSCAGDWLGALEGGEKVYYYGGPGLRYLRAFERLIFGDTFLGYLSLILLLPLRRVRRVQALPRRARGASRLTLIFIAIPIGAMFGSTYFQYVKWAARGFADPAAATLFLAAIVVLVGRTPDGPGSGFAPAFGAGLLFALALWVRPNLAPGAAVLLGGGRARRAVADAVSVALAGLCIGFLPVFGMALHNWYFGGVFVLFSSNAHHRRGAADAAVGLCCRARRGAAASISRASTSGAACCRSARWLAGPSEVLSRMVPLTPPPSRSWSASRCGARLRSVAASDRRRDAGAACGRAVLSVRPTATTI